MDHQTLAKQIVSFLTPFLPYLLKAGEKVAEEIGKKFSEAAWEKAQALWGKLRGKERVQKAAEAVVALPDNPAIQQGVEAEIARALQEDGDLRREIARLWAEVQAAGVVASNSTINIGDGNVVGDGSTSQVIKAEGGSTISNVRQEIKK